MLFRTQGFDKRTPGLFKVEWCGDGIVGLCSKTYYCFGATDKYSTKGLSKRRSGGGFNRGFRVRDSSVMTYIQERAALTYFYGKRKVLADGLSTAPLEMKRKRQPDDHSFTHMDPRWKHPFTCIVAGPTGCDKTFATRLLRNSSTMIDPSPERVTWYYGEWQSAYETLDIPNLHLEKDCRPLSMLASAISWC